MCYPERCPCIVALCSYHNLKGNFHNVWSLWWPTDEGERYPPIPCIRNPLWWHQPGLPNGTCIYRRKSDGIFTINLKRPWEKLLLTVHAIEILSEVSVITFRKNGQQAVLKFAAAFGATSFAATLLLESLLTRSRQPSRSHNFWQLLIPGLKTSLSLRCLRLTNLPVPSVTQTLLYTVWTLPSSATTKELTQWL